MRPQRSTSHDAVNAARKNVAETSAVTRNVTRSSLSPGCGVERIAATSAITPAAAATTSLGPERPRSVIGIAA